MTIPTLMVLGARRAQLAAIEAAKRMGFSVVAVDPDPKAPGFELADLSYVFDLADKSAQSHLLGKMRSS